MVVRIRNFFPPRPPPSRKGFGLRRRLKLRSFPTNLGTLAGGRGEGAATVGPPGALVRTMPTTPTPTPPVGQKPRLSTFKRFKPHDLLARRTCEDFLKIIES